MKKQLVRYGAFFLAVLLLTACGGGNNAVSAGGGAEIPEEILGELDQETLQELVEEPKYVALTFDDGPRRDTTSLLLDGLLERGVPATFFVIGQQIAGNEDLLERMKAEGHQIGNHTYSHTRLLTADTDKVVEEIQKTEVLLTELLGEDDYWLRPPYGAIGKTRAAALYRHFKTVKAISAASEEDLLAAPGMTRPAAEAVYSYFHPAENTPD